MKKQMIYDCVTFFNELDLLEIRLEELNDVVDYFVIVEANKGFSGKKKPLYFLENKKRYKKWEKKIIYVPIKDMPNITPIIENEFFNRLIKRVDKRKLYRRFKSALSIGRWKLQNYQRDQIVRGLKNCGSNDIVIVSDVDEFWDKKRLGEMKKLLKNNYYVGFEQIYYAYYFNGLLLQNGKPFKGPFSKCCQYGDLIEKFRGSPQQLRVKRKWGVLGDVKDLKVIKNGGWHFTYLGGEKKVIEKLKNVSENGFDIERALENIRNGYFGDDLSLKINYVRDLSYLPGAILKNMRKWKNYFKGGNRVLR